MIEKNSRRGTGSTGGSDQEPLEGSVLAPEEGVSAEEASREEPIIIEADPVSSTERGADSDRKTKRRKKLKVEQEYLPREDDQASTGWQPSTISEDDPWFEQAKRADDQAREARERAEWAQWAESSGVDPSILAKGLSDAGSPEENLQDNVSRAGKSYMGYLRRAKLLEEGKPRKERVSQLTDLQKAYGAMMSLSCMQGFSQGLSAQNIARTVGMASTMWMMSPNFRQYTKELGQSTADQAGELLDKFSEKAIEKRAKKENHRVGKAENKSLRKGKPLSEKWAERKAAMKAYTEGRYPHTVQSAAMTVAALDQSLYLSLQQEDADSDELRTAHTAMVSTVYGHAQEDGLDPEEVTKATRVLIGQMIVDEPAMAGLYSELGHGTFTMSESRTVRTPDGNVAQIWEGGFENGLHQRVTNGAFTVRGPMSAEEHEAAISDRITADLLGSTSQEDAHGAIIGYAAGYHSPDPHSQSTDDAFMDKRVKIAGTMRSTMTMDGIPDDEQQLIYSNAYMNALELVREINPEVEQRWAQKYGETWKDDLGDFIKDPMAAKAEQDRRQEERSQANAPYTAGPAASDSQQSQQRRNTRRYQRARTNQAYNEIETGRLTGIGSDDFEPPSADYEMGG